MSEQKVIPGIDFDAVETPDGVKYVQHPDWLPPAKPRRRRKVTKGQEQETLWEDMAKR